VFLIALRLEQVPGTFRFETQFWRASGAFERFLWEFVSI
jgi:hypothetical protein